MDVKNMPFCDECEKYIEFTIINCSEHLLHRILVTCNIVKTILRRLMLEKEDALLVVGQLNIN